MQMEVFDSVWDAIADTPAEAANLKLRAELMHQVAAVIKGNSWNQIEAAKHCGITQSRMNELLRGRISNFTIDALIDIATAHGCGVHVELTLD